MKIHDELMRALNAVPGQVIRFERSTNRYANRPGGLPPTWREAWATHRGWTEPSVADTLSDGELAQRMGHGRFGYVLSNLDRRLATRHDISLADGWHGSDWSSHSIWLTAMWYLWSCARPTSHNPYEMVCDVRCGIREDAYIAHEAAMLARMGQPIPSLWFARMTAEDIARCEDQHVQWGHQGPLRRLAGATA